MTLKISNKGTEITTSSNPNLASYVKKYGDWVEVLANGGKWLNDGVYDSAGKLSRKINGSIARDDFGDEIKFPEGLGGSFGFEVINDEVSMEIIGYMVPTSTDRRVFYGLNGKRIFDVDQSDPNAKKSGCYVATCVYGSYDCPEVWTLRRFRDDTLDNSRIGKLLIHLYYTASPYIVRLLEKTYWPGKLLKPLINCIVKWLQVRGVDKSPYCDKH